MNYATFARKESDPSASRAKAAPSPVSGGLRIGDADDPYEWEADRVADEVISVPPSKQHWSFSNIRISGPQDSAPVLRRQPKPEEGGGKIRPLVQKFIRGEATEQEKQTLRDLLMTDQLRPEEVDALKQYIGRMLADQVMKSAVGGHQGQININIGGPMGNVHTYFKAKLKLKLSGAAKIVGGGLEGTLETLVEINADKDKKKVIVHITPPGNTMLAELVRAKAFPQGELTFELGEQFVEALNMVSLGGELTIVLTGKKASKAGGLVISSHDIPEDVELEATLSQSADRPELAPATGDPARPPIKAFVTGGMIADPRQKGATTTVGLDVPLENDTKDPLKYGGFGLRAAADTRGGARLGGAGFVGLNLNPVVLQLAFEAGIARFPRSQPAPGNGAREGGYFGAEASVGVRVTKHVEVMALASLISGLGDRDLAGAGSVQLGAGFTF
ncbi:MAG: hypothetical protein CV088_02670 [Nitrospira sp. LK70]|nr:hypothetical protein [Nitrospira sp. LK70]